MNLFDLRVGCHEGHKGRERPAWVELEGRRVRVAEILDRWYQGPEKAGGEAVNYFKVCLEDGRVILLRYVPLFDRWAGVESGP